MMVADGKPVDVLNRYQKLIMEREELSKRSNPMSRRWVESSQPGKLKHPPLSYTYRHGDGSAEVVSIELLDAAHCRVEIVETGLPVSLRMRVFFHRDIKTRFLDSWCATVTVFRSMAPIQNNSNSVSRGGKGRVGGGCLLL